MASLFLNRYKGLSSVRVMEFEVVTSKREMGTALQSSEPSSEVFERSARCVIRADCFFRCILINTRSAEIRAFQDLQTHFIRIRYFTPRKDKTSTISSSGRITSSTTTLGGGGIFIGTVWLLKFKVKRFQIFFKDETLVK